MTGYCTATDYLFYRMIANRTEALFSRFSLGHSPSVTVKVRSSEQLNK